ncbi:putative GNAT superfamily acetyltransferase [Marmoricola sp. OAE513]|uniref:GNAT family N-acetyltransferase n=1 Tax=Marmoricola sp. OAE513 TaxID=2817894 RepID=UPI001AE7B5B7
MTESSLLRPITPGDHALVLDLNETNVELLAPLDEPRLVELVAAAETAAVISHEGRDVGFVITFADGAGIDGPNFEWFSARHPGFLYLDRIVLDASARRTGIGSRVYDELEARAAERGPVLCLEVNIEPPNDASLAFHRARGFVEVGQQEANGHVVSLMEKRVGPPGS